MTRLRLVLLAMAVAALLLVGTASAALAGVDNQLGAGFEHMPILSRVGTVLAGLAAIPID